MPKRRGLSPLEEKFCQLLAGDPKGNQADAYIGAGYTGRGSAKTIRKEASKVANRPHVVARLRALAEDDPAIKSRQDLQRWWSTVVDDDGEEMKDRIKASELLGKSQAAFTEKHEHNVGGDGSAAVVVYVPDNGRGPKAPQGDGSASA